MKPTFSRNVLLLIVLFCQTMNLLAQQQLRPIKLHNATAANLTSNLRTQGDSAIFVTLPFFDDFANQLGSPDTAKWQDGEGTYINNSFGIDPYTIGVATFDGLQESGEPYSLDALGLTGEADRLTSHCFDLTGFSLSDSLQLTFYWQAQGLGELPNGEDFFKLEFLDSAGTWVNQWQVNGDSLTSFNFQQINIENGVFLHNKFQFRFVNFGRLSGGYDTWNLDYLFFDTKESRSITIPIDFGFTGFAPSRTTTYRSVPAQHLLNNLNDLWVDTLAIDVRSATATAFQIRRAQLLTEIYAPSLVSSTIVEPINNIPVQLFPTEKQASFFLNDINLVNTLSVDSLTIIDTYILDNTSFAGDAAIVRPNDTLEVTSIFADYYAYDDGSAELGYGVNEQFGKIAYQFEALQEDTLRYVDLFLAQLGGQASGSFKLKVWSSIDTVTGEDVELLSTASYPILYTDNINEFQRLQLDEYVPIPKGTFFIGIEQLSDQDMMIGFDKNNDAGDKIFYNLGNKWFQNQQFRGSLMLRPVFEFPSTVVGIAEDIARLKEVVVYPNPTKQEVWIRGEVEHVSIYSLTGKLIHSQEMSKDTDKRLQLPALENGMYILKLQKGNAVASKKLVIDNNQ